VDIVTTRASQPPNRSPRITSPYLRLLPGAVEPAIEISERASTAIRLIPLSRGPHPCLAGSFIIMGFPIAMRSVVCVETMNRSLYLEEESEVERYTAAFTDLRERVLTPGRGTQAPRPLR
jgi:hypothetical protein